MPRRLYQESVSNFITYSKKECPMCRAKVDNMRITRPDIQLNNISKY